MQLVLQSTGIAGTSSVENIPGAAGTIALARLVSAERGSGDVLMVSGLIMLGAVVTHQSPVTLREVTPIARLTGEFEVVAVPANSPYRTLADLMAAFKARPESISWGGGSAGGTDQMLAGLIADAVGVAPRRVNYIAFAGGGESLSAILGGQVSAGIASLSEFAPQVEAGTLRLLGVSSATRLPTIDVPTLVEQGVGVELENWRSLVAPPNLSEPARERLLRAVTAMVATPAWRETLARYRWTDRFLAGDAFQTFMRAEEARVEATLARLGTGTPASSPTAVGRYPVFVLTGLALTTALFALHLRRSRVPGVPSAGEVPGVRAPWRAVILVSVAAVIDLLLVDITGFIVASSLLFWLTARAFDPSHPIRDALVGAGFSTAAYVVFARLLQLPLPPGMLPGWL